ncbi:MAG: DUF2712 domain-containing protein, partial [Dorea sp.]|nr:DUF2712 domain-containing protein [Dorea sp.]
SQNRSWRNSQPALFSVSQNTCRTHWNGEKQPHKSILWTKVLIFQGANPIFDVGSLSYKAKSKASKTDVRLGAENNNDSPNTYAISGYWDEETN